MLSSILNRALGQQPSMSIAESEREIVFEITIPALPTFIRATLAILIPGIAAVLPWRSWSLPGVLFGLVVMGVILVDALSGPIRTTLRAGNLDFIGVSKGARVVLTRKGIRWLGYKRGGEDEPDGLYADGKEGFVCLLVNADEHQANTAIRAIVEKFPDMHEQLAQPSAFGKQFIRLGLTG